jgi:hypothetical protein
VHPAQRALVQLLEARPGEVLLEQAVIQNLKEGSSSSSSSSSRDSAAQLHVTGARCRTSYMEQVVAHQALRRGVARCWACSSRGAGSSRQWGSLAGTTRGWPLLLHWRER